MKTIYLAGTKAAVLADLQKLNPEISEESLPELSGNGWAAHWVGQIMKTPPVLDEQMNVVTPPVITEDYHANIWVFDDYPTKQVG